MKLLQFLKIIDMLDIWKLHFFVQEYEVDFTPPFQRISMIAELEKQLGVTFPPASTIASPG